MYKMRKFFHNWAEVDNNGSEGSVSELISHQCFSYAGVVDGEDGGACVVAMANAVDYSVDGEIYQLAASSTNWDCRGLTSITGPQVQYVAFVADAAGATTPVQGTAAASTTGATFPSIPDDTVCVGYIVMDVQHLTTNEDYTWDQELSSHGTYHNGIPRTELFDVIDPDA